LRAVHTVTDQDLPDDDMDDSIYDIPVTVKAVLGKTTMLVSQLLKLGRGAVVALDRRLDEPVDVYANDRLIARGEVIVSDEVRIGVSLTEILASTSHPGF
jgi:flagellar motor switch protein FliN/FliY